MSVGGQTWDIYWYLSSGTGYYFTTTFSGSDYGTWYIDGSGIGPWQQDGGILQMNQSQTPWAWAGISTSGSLAGSYGDFGGFTFPFFGTPSAGGATLAAHARKTTVKEMKEMNSRRSKSKGKK